MCLPAEYLQDLRFVKFSISNVSRVLVLRWRARPFQKMWDQKEQGAWIHVRFCPWLLEGPKMLFEKWLVKQVSNIIQSWY